MSTKVSNFSIDSILSLPRSHSNVGHFNNNNDDNPTYCELDSTSDVGGSNSSKVMSWNQRESDTASDVACVTSSTSSPSSQRPHQTLEGSNHVKETTIKLRKKPRTTFSNCQLTRMEQRYRLYRYLPPDERADLAQELGLTNQQVKHWFQNRRMKEKRQSSSFNVAANRLPPDGAQPRQLQAVPEIMPYPVNHLTLNHAPLSSLDMPYPLMTPHFSHVPFHSNGCYHDISPPVPYY